MGVSKRDRKRRDDGLRIEFDRNIERFLLGFWLRGT